MATGYRPIRRKAGSPSSSLQPARTVLYKEVAPERDQASELKVASACEVSGNRR